MENSGTQRIDYPIQQVKNPYNDGKIRLTWAGHMSRMNNVKSPEADHQVQWKGREENVLGLDGDNSRDIIGMWTGSPLQRIQ